MKPEGSLPFSQDAATSIKSNDRYRKELMGKIYEYAHHLSTRFRSCLFS